MAGGGDAHDRDAATTDTDGPTDSLSPSEPYRAGSPRPATKPVRGYESSEASAGSSVGCHDANHRRWKKNPLPPHVTQAAPKQTHCRRCRCLQWLTRETARRHRDRNARPRPLSCHTFPPLFLISWRQPRLYLYEAPCEMLLTNTPNSLVSPTPQEKPHLDSRNASSLFASFACVLV